VRTPKWDRERFGELLKEIGDRAHLDQGGLAELAGRSRSQINRWTRSENQPAYDAVARLATAITGRYPHLSDLAREFMIAAGYQDGPPAQDATPPSGNPASDLVAQLRAQAAAQGKTLREVLEDGGAHPDELDPEAQARLDRLNEIFQMGMQEIVEATRRGRMAGEAEAS
jgi:transcriptional regulator with XRE-family HTH domain